MHGGFLQHCFFKLHSLYPHFGFKLGRFNVFRRHGSWRLLPRLRPLLRTLRVWLWLPLLGVLLLCLLLLALLLLGWLRFSRLWPTLLLPGGFPWLAWLRLPRCPLLLRVGCGLPLLLAATLLGGLLRGLGLLLRCRLWPTLWPTLLLFWRLCSGRLAWLVGAASPLRWLLAGLLRGWLLSCFWGLLGVPPFYLSCLLLRLLTLPASWDLGRRLRIGLRLLRLLATLLLWLLSTAIG